MADLHHQNARASTPSTAIYSYPAGKGECSETLDALPKKEAIPVGKHDDDKVNADLWSKALVSVQYLTQHAAMWDPEGPVCRRKLKRRHIPLFEEESSLFNDFARTVCEAEGLARKEVFETWASAVLIDAAFPEARRVADVAAGHGLLAWALLLLDDARTPTSSQPPRTALCVDRRLAGIAEKLEAAFLRRWPGLAGRCHFVEGALADLAPDPSCLLVSVHACGGLSDALVAAAAHAPRGPAPLALVPCCHSRKKLAGFSPLARDLYAEIAAAADLTGAELVDRLDAARAAVLERRGYRVDVALLPPGFTEKNRMLLARPGPDLPPPPADGEAAAAAQPLAAAGGARPRSPRRRLGVPPAAARIPCADTAAARAAVAALAGRAAAAQRRAVAATLDVSLWLPPPPGTGAVGARALAALASSLSPGVRAIAEVVGPPFTNSAGRTARTFRLAYYCSAKTVEGENAKREVVHSGGNDSLEEQRKVPHSRYVPLDKEEATRIHFSLYERIPDVFPGAECR